MSPSGPLHAAVPPPGSVYLEANAIRNRVGELALDLDASLAGAHAPLLVGVLSGAVTFLADLSRALVTEHELAFVGVAGFDGRSPTPEIRLSTDVDCPLAGRDVIVVDDVVDTGLTLHYVVRTLRARRPRTLRACVLLDRPYRRIVEDLPLAHVGFATADVELAGYGIDHHGRHRELGHISELQDTRIAA